MIKKLDFGNTVKSLQCSVAWQVENDTPIVTLVPHRCCLFCDKSLKEFSTWKISFPFTQRYVFQIYWLLPWCPIPVSEHFLKNYKHPQSSWSRLNWYFNNEWESSCFGRKHSSWREHLENEYMCFRCYAILLPKMTWAAHLENLSYLHT